MASIKKFRDKWYARIQTWDHGARREKLIPLKTKSKVEARVRIAQIEKVEKDIKDGVEFDFPWIRNNGGKTKVKPLILADAIDKFINHRIKSDSLRAATISINRRALNLLMDVIGNIPVESITLPHIDTFAEYSLAHNHSKHTINIGIRTIRTFMIWLYDRELISKILKIKSLKTNHNEPKYITEVEYNKLMLLDFGHPRFSRMFKLYWETGLRLSESFIGVINGNWLDIPADKSKNHKERSIKLNKEQTETINILQSHYQENPSIDSIKWYSKKFKKGLLKIGILNKHFHCLRHSFGTRRILETNGNIHLVRDEMGHSSVTVTERYTRLNRKRVMEDFPSSYKYYISDNMLKNDKEDTLLEDTEYYEGAIIRGELN